MLLVYYLFDSSVHECYFLFSEESKTGVTRMKQIALATSMVKVILSVGLWGEFDSSSVQYQFVK